MCNEKVNLGSAEMYQHFIGLLLKEHPEYWTKKVNGPHKSRTPNAFVYTKKGNQVIEVFSYARWQKIVNTYYLLARKHVIDGGELNLGANLGVIKARTISRYHGNRKINFSETRKQPLIFDPAQNKMVRERIIYYDSDTYSRIAWKKLKRIPNERMYKFQPAQGASAGKGFTGEFSTALKENPILETRYEQKLSELL